MRIKIYLLTILSAFCFYNSGLSQAGGVEDIDIGVFPVGTYNQTSGSNEVFEIALKFNSGFTAIPIPEAFIFYLYAPTALLTGGETFDATQELNMGSGADMFYQGFSFPVGTNTYFGFSLNGGDNFNPSTFPAGQWRYVYTVNIGNLAGGATAADFRIADGSSDMYAAFSERTKLTFGGFNEFLPMSSMPALPLDLVSFEASKMNEKSSHLVWTTVNEVNTSTFAVQRSFDKKNWVTIGNVKAAGNSVSIQNYSFVDENVYNGRDASLNAYYRLHMIDLDGYNKVSPVRSVVFGSIVSATREFAVYPNPASDGIQVAWDANALDQPTALEFYDIQGKLVYTRKVSDNTNQEYIDLGVTNLQAGLYLLRIMNGTEPLEHRQIVVQR